MSRKKLELYFHIPFCVRKCLYCDFLSAPGDEATKNAYMEALLTEVRERAEEYGEYVVDTVFIGGGTPSVVEGVWIERLMALVREVFHLSEKAEITIEVNPGTVDAKKLKQYFGAGINRLSIGLQSAKDEELKGLGRIHTWKQFLDTYQLARKAGFSNVNVDVMSALPGQTFESYCETLEVLMRLKPQPEHVSAYSLIVEEGTYFGELYEAGKLSLPDEDCERAMYEATAEILGKAGYERYEISNYAKKGFACRHNCGYWRRVDYVGFGIGAASLVADGRFQNGSDMGEYLATPLGCRSRVQRLTIKEQMEEFMFLGLRETRGISVKKFYETFGKPIEMVYGDVIEKNIADGLLEYLGAETATDTKSEVTDRHLALTLRGMDISNYVMAQFLLE